MRKDFTGLEVAAAALMGAFMTSLFAAQAVPAADLPTSAGANACAQWHLSAADFTECQAVWSSARNDAERRDVQKRFQARGMIIPGSRAVPADPEAAVIGSGPGAATEPKGRLNSGGKTGAPANMSASPSK